MPEKTSPNIFILLDLDPTKPWNQAEFERQLQKKRQEWSRLVNMPTQKGIQAKQNLGLIPELQRIAADETLRKAQAEAAQQEKNAAQAEAIKKFEEQLELIQIKGYILEGELSRLIKDFAGVLSEREIRGRLKVSVQKEQATARPRAAALEPDQAKTIGVKLNSLGKTDLYDFLGIGRADNEKLVQQARILYKAVQDKGTKTADDTIAAELTGYCITIFKSDTERAKYDETLRLQAYESLKEKVDVIGQVSKRVDSKQMDELLREAREQRLNPDEALVTIREHAAKRGFSIVETEKMAGVVKELQRCGYCGKLNDKDKKHCVACGQPLQEPCPKCAQMVASEETACGACGFSVGNRLYVMTLLNDVGQARGKRDLDAATVLLEQARQAWPSTGTDALGRRIKELESQIQPDKTVRDALIQELDKAVGQKHLYKARGLLSKLEPLLPNDNPLPRKYRGQIDPKIQQAETQLRQIQAKTSDPEAAIRGYQEILSICQDCQEAREILARTPPSPPSNLKAGVSGRVVHLNWQPSPSSGVRYLLVRKKQSRPIAAGDGEQVAAVEGALYDDNTAQIGMPTYYAVYADREGTVSKDAAALAQPVLILQDVAQITARVADRQVHLRWQVPPNVHRVLVVRSETGYVTRPEEGVLISPLDTGQAVDNEVENNRSYFYTVFCQFLDHAGRLQLTRGARIEATPQPPPSPVEDITITDSGPFNARQVLIRWQPVAKGEVVILKAMQPTGLEFGAVIPQPDLATYGQVLATSGNQASDQISRLGFYYYVPVVVFHGLAYIGPEKRYVCVEDVSELTVQNMGTALRLHWRWPTDCQEVLVAYSYTGWPQPHAPDCTTISLTRAQYELRGHYDITNPVKANHYIIVFATVSQGDQRIVAAGENESARRLVYLTSRISVTYEIKKPRIGKGFNLNLTIDGEGTLPSLILMAKQSVLPMSKSDGAVILRVESGTIQKRNFSFSISSESIRWQHYGRLFLEDDSLYGAVVIRHPDKEKLRLF
jgi:hypothetical protein